MIARHGYLSETHVVVTKDGYLLKLHRIPAKTNNKKEETIFLQHGLLGSSADWLINGNNSLGFLLADQGYDVWLGNARGNLYSKGHINLSTESEKFWNFSWHEMGTKDLPAVFSYINTVTQRKNITYIGHSMGTTMFFALSSTSPNLAENVTLMVALAPVAYMTHIKSPIKYLAPFANDIEWVARYFGLNQFLPNDKIMKFLAYDCELLKIEKQVCENIIFIISGFDKKELNQDILPVIFAKEPAGTSTKTVIHYAQEINNGCFQQYDYGSKKNLIYYGTKTPPQYNLTNIKQNIFLMYGQNDWLANYIDVRNLAANLKNLRSLYKIPMEGFNHIDFLFGKDAEKLVYKPILRLIEKSSKM
ncbi:lipase 3-like isoform X2 [Cylas formicarius]|nr:lipase 3-like isoform X2 [Cylas formicarius]XP_060532394.1 lipase 3-like isoform X2 [Cylas formicarius]